MTTRSHSDQPPVSSDPQWMLLCALFVIALCLLALPAIIIGFLMQLVMTRLLSCLWSFGIWVILLIPCVYLLTQWYQHGLQAAMIHEVIGYFLAAKQYQYDLARWPWKRLLAQTWLLWIETLVGIPIAGFWFEQVRSFGGSLVIAAQGYAALGLPEYAHRILDSCSTYILHACSDPMPIIERAGKTLRLDTSWSEDEEGVAKKHTRVTWDWKVPVNAVLQQEVGQAFWIYRGRAQHVQTAQVALTQDQIREAWQVIRQQEAESRTLQIREEPSPEAKPAPTGKSGTGSAQARRHAPKQKSQQATKVVSVERVPAAVVAPPLQVMPEVSPPPMPTPDPRVPGQDGDDEPDRL